MLTQERKQKYLNTFIQRLNGIGPAISASGNCYYVLEGHPGCAIGCQDEFQPFKDDLKNETILTVYCICSLGYSNKFKRANEFIKAFGLTAGESHHADATFLRSLQILHDVEHHWINKKIQRKPVEDFCKRNNLTVPEADYA